MQASAVPAMTKLPQMVDKVLIVKPVQILTTKTWTRASSLIFPLPLSIGHFRSLQHTNSVPSMKALALYMTYDKHHEKAERLVTLFVE